MELTTNFTAKLCNEPIPANLRLYTVKEVAEILKTNKKFVYRLINANVIPAIKIGSTKIRHDSLVKFLDNAEGLDFTTPETIRKLVIVA